MLTLLRQKVETLFSGYFSLVMATGALSIAAHLLGMESISFPLLYVNIIAYIILWFLTGYRLIRFFPRVVSDLTAHTTGPGFFTLVAGTCVLGSQLIVVAEHYTFAIILWFIGILLWFIIMYVFFVSVIVRKEKPKLEEGINGAWLIAAVGTHAISILGTLVSPQFEAGREVVLFYALSMYFLGCMLYLNIITLIFYRLTFLRLNYTALTPPYWINMGAVAITTLAGSTLILNGQDLELIQIVMPFLKGFTMFFWVAGTWWIPLLFILMIWRYVYHHFPLTYEPQFWGMAFPLAMYTTSTFQLSKALEVPFLLAIPNFMIYISLIAWGLIFFGLLRHLYTDIAGSLRATTRENSVSNR